MRTISGRWLILPATEHLSINLWPSVRPVYIQNLRQHRAIAIDVGDQDGLRVDAGKFHDLLDSYGIANSFEIFPGTHTSNVAFRFQDHVMPFFSQNLSFEQSRR